MGSDGKEARRRRGHRSPAHIIPLPPRATPHPPSLALAHHIPAYIYTLFVCVGLVSPQGGGCNWGGEDLDSHDLALTPALTLSLTLALRYVRCPQQVNPLFLLFYILISTIMMM